MFLELARRYSKESKVTKRVHDRGTRYVPNLIADVKLPQSMVDDVKLCDRAVIG